MPAPLTHQLQTERAAARRGGSFGDRLRNQGWLTTTSGHRMSSPMPGTVLLGRMAGAAMSGMPRDEMVDLTGYPADRVLRILQDAGISDLHN